MTSTYPVLATYPADTTPARRWEIWEAVAPLFEQHGFHGVTIDELAAEAGVRTAELYRHFSSRSSRYTRCHARMGSTSRGSAEW